MPNPDAPRCECRWFDRASKNPNIPVTFDEQTNEFHLTYLDGGGYSVFYHCPFCGGRAPESIRKTLFTEVSHDEASRLHLLTKEVTTEEQLIQLLGQPDTILEISGGSTNPGTESEPPETSIGGRRLVFEKFSGTANINVRIDRYGKLKFSFMAKYIGKKEPAKNSQ